MNSSDATEPRTLCPYFDRHECRSCEWLELDYSEQLKRKEQHAKEALSFLAPFELEPSVASPELGFRNRAKMSVTGTSQNPVIGLLGKEKLDQGQDLLACPIHHPKLNRLMAALPDLIRTYDLAPYRIEEKRGELKGLIAYYTPGADQMYLRFVLRSKECISRIRKLLPAIQAQFPELVCVSANIQPVPHAILEGPEEIFLTERSFIDLNLEDLRFKLSPRAFVQTNVHVATRLYQTAARWIAEVHPQRVLELYCGQGAFSFFAAQSAAEILGIEINPEAVKTANETAHELGLNHLKFKSLDAAQVESEIEGFEPDLILANPPRRGLAEAVRLIERRRPADFLYSSCAIETLAADLKILSSEYRLKRIQIFDMFPHTKHFETLVWLTRVRF